MAVEVDLAEPDGPAQLVAAAGERLDVLVNNVGVARDASRDSWRSQMRRGSTQSTST
jgi:NAD(P)-dependent dehydrogenase (short-subunit alcohol dehydrogenase family)